MEIQKKSISMPENHPTPYVKGALYGVLAVSIWAGWMAVTRLGVTSTLDALDITALRFAVAGIILLPVLLRMGLAMDRLGLARLMLLVSGAGAPYALVAAQGLKFAPAADAGALVPGVMPLFVAVLSAGFLGERPSASKMAGLAMIFLGVVSLGGASLFSGESARSEGHLLFLCAAFMWACFTVTMRWAKLTALHATALVSVGSMIGFLPVYFAIAGLRLIDQPIGDLVIQGLYQGVLATVVSLTLFGRAVAILGASSGAAFGALVPVMAAFLAIPLLNEMPSPTDWIGIGAISIGVYFSSGGPMGLICRLCCYKHPPESGR